MSHCADVVAAAERLSAAFASRDVAAAMACFVPGDDIGYAGSERTEIATGRTAVEALFTAVFARHEAYSWRTTSALTQAYGNGVYLFSEAVGTAGIDGGGTEQFTYRVSGILERVGDRWLWRHCHGCEPADR